MTPLAVLLVSLAIKSSFLLCLGLLMAAVPRLSAATRHLTLLAALLSTLALPVISLCVPSLDVPLLEPELQARATQYDGAHVASIEPSTTSSRLSASPSALAVSLLLAWAVGASLLVVRAVRSWIALHALIRRARPVPDLRWLGLLDECCEKLSLPRPPLVVSDETDVAFVCGWLEPVIVIPAESGEWSEAQRRDVLLHELSHIERRDALTQFAAQIAHALYFWNPLALMAERRLREEREYACDDRVLACGQEQDTYATTLVDVAEGLSGHYRPVAPAMVRTSQLEKRVLAVLDSSRNRDRVSVAKGIVVGVSSVTLLLSLAALRAAETDPHSADPNVVAAGAMPPPPVAGSSGIRTVTISPPPGVAAPVLPPGDAAAGASPAVARASPVASSVRVPESLPPDLSDIPVAPDSNAPIGVWVGVGSSTADAGQVMELARDVADPVPPD